MTPTVIVNHSLVSHRIYSSHGHAVSKLHNAFSGYYVNGRIILFQNLGERQRGREAAREEALTKQNEQTEYRVIKEEEESLITCARSGHTGCRSDIMGPSNYTTRECWFTCLWIVGLVYRRGGGVVPRLHTASFTHIPRSCLTVCLLQPELESPGGAQ